MRGRPIGPKREPTQYLGFRVGRGLLARIDAHAKRLVRTTPWLHSPRTGRSDAIRDLLLLALDAIEVKERKAK